MSILSAVSMRRLWGPCWGSCCFNLFFSDLRTLNKGVNAAHGQQIGTLGSFRCCHLPTWDTIRLTTRSLTLHFFEERSVKEALESRTGSFSRLPTDELELELEQLQLQDSSVQRSICFCSDFRLTFGKSELHCICVFFSKMKGRDSATTWH